MHGGPFATRGGGRAHSLIKFVVPRNGSATSLSPIFIFSSQTARDHAGVRDTEKPSLYRARKYTKSWPANRTLT